MTEQRHAELGLHAVDAADLPGRRRILRRTQLAALVVVLLLGVGAARTLLLRAANARSLQASTAENARVYVRTTQPRRGGAQTLSLPGTLQGLAQSPISARASGYVKRWTHDIGSRVRAGELLAEIDTPEIDQQLRQAVAAREQAAAGLLLARSTAERWEGLRAKDVVSQQDLDEKRNAAAQSQANVAAAEANVQRLRQTEAFKRVLAPYAGILTRRSVEVGDLVDPARVLFTLTQNDPLRVVVAVPQADVQRVKPGQAVFVTQQELRGRRFDGRVTRTAGAIDAATRTMQVEVGLPNPDGVLLPGAYVQVALPLAAGSGLLLSTNTLLFRAEGTLVAVVDAQGRVTLRPVVVGRNHGTEFELQGGLAESDHVVLNPPDSIADGQIVTPARDAP